MLIRIMYRDGRFDMVKNYFLDWLIESGRIAMFQRSDGWAVLGRDPVRNAGNGLYHRDERRAVIRPPLIALLAMRLKQEEWLRGEHKEPNGSAPWKSRRYGLH